MPEDGKGLIDDWGLMIGDCGLGRTGSARDRRTEKDTDYLTFCAFAPLRENINR